MVDIGKYLYLYLDNESMTGYVGETNDLKNRHRQHKGSIWPGRRELVSKIGEPVIIKTDFKNMKAVQFAEHAAYEKYKAEGYDMLQKPPHPNIFNKYKDRVDDCKICDELGCDFTKERLEYILAVHRVSKLCPVCEKPFYYDPKKFGRLQNFYGQKYCSYVCSNKDMGIKKRKNSFNVSKLCKQCKKVFYFDKKKHNTVKQFNKLKFCSYSCRGKNTGIKLHTSSFNISKLCEVCDKLFYFDKKKHNTVKQFNKLKFCSISCTVNGENNPKASINTVIARTIKFLLFYTTLTHKEIADGIPGATPAIVSMINSGKNWKDVKLHNKRFYNV
jgi:hypothetical protein